MGARSLQEKENKGNKGARNSASDYKCDAKTVVRILFEKNFFFFLAYNCP